MKKNLFESCFPVFSGMINRQFGKFRDFFLNDSLLSIRKSFEKI